MNSPLSGNNGVELVANLVQFINSCLHGDVPQVIAPVFYGASLITLRKNDGGIRPIAIGETIRSVAGRAFLIKLSDRIYDLLVPCQLGLGTPRGAEILIHSVRDYLDGVNHSPGQEIIKIDYRNAFNSIRRDHILCCVSDTIPELLPYIKSFHLWFSTII